MRSSDIIGFLSNFSLSSRVFSLDELLCQAHQHFEIIQSPVATALLYRVSFTGIVDHFMIRVCLTAVPACRSSVGCLVPFSLADTVPWRFIDPPFVRRLFILKTRNRGNLTRQRFFRMVPDNNGIKFIYTYIQCTFHINLT
jgi:hypothetical protein